MKKHFFIRDRVSKETDPKRPGDCPAETGVSFCDTLQAGGSLSWLSRLFRTRGLTTASIHVSSGGILDRAVWAMCGVLDVGALGEVFHG